MDETTRLLIRARRRIGRPSRWTRYYVARDAHGLWAPVFHPAALRWCAVGALQAECCTVRERHADTRLPAAVRFDEPAYERALARLAAALPSEGSNVPSDRVAYFNDHGTHARVLALYDEAIRGK